jgi:hypothetical protein
LKDIKENSNNMKVFTCMVKPIVGGEGSQNKTPSMNFVGVSAVSCIEPMLTLGFCMVEAPLANERAGKMDDAKLYKQHMQ